MSEIVRARCPICDIEIETDLGVVAIVRTSPRVARYERHLTSCRPILSSRERSVLAEGMLRREQREGW